MNENYNWQAHENVTPENAVKITTFSDDDPESMILYFYASHIRGDNRWRKVVPIESEWSNRLKYQLKEYQSWKLIRFRLVNKIKKFSSNRLWIKVYFTFEVNGHEDGGEDEVILEQQNGKWIIIEVPTALFEEWISIDEL